MRKTDQLTFNLYDGIFEQICSLDSLWKSYKDVKKNRGAPGIDGISIENYGHNLLENLKVLQQEVETWEYIPSPVKRVEIPKPNGGIRKLGIPTVKDRVLHASIKNALAFTKIPPLVLR
jgi:RNA-directed DNA polymerase